MPPVVVNSGEFRRAAFLSLLGLLAAWWFDVEKTISNASKTNFVGYTLFWLTFTYIVIYYTQTIRKVSHQSRALISPTFPDLPRRRSSVFECLPPVLTKGLSPTGVMSRAGYLARRLSTFDAQTPLPTATSPTHGAETAWPARSQTLQSGLRRDTHPVCHAFLRARRDTLPAYDPLPLMAPLSRISDVDNDDDVDDESTCSTAPTPATATHHSKRSSLSTECTSTLITCNTIDVTFGNPAEVITALCIVLLAGFIIATYREYGFGSIFIGMTTGLGICNLAELLKVFTEPVTLRWILALTAFHILNFPTNKGQFPFLAIY